jgi:hypothetical protein
MNCPNCNEPVEPGAVFCGNCGQKLSDQDVNLKLNADIIPEYSEPNLVEQTRRTEESMSLVFGVVGVVGSLFVPLAGIVIGLTGVVMASLTVRRGKDLVNIFGAVISIIAILTGIGAWIHASSVQKASISKVNNSAAVTNSSDAVSTNYVQTPCYKMNFTSKLNIQNVPGNCNMNAFNGATFVLSTEAYKVYATKTNYTSDGFVAMAKQAIDKDVKLSLATFTVSHEESGVFAASPAYFVTVSNGQGVSIIEAVALHPTTSGENFFVFVHAVLGDQADLHDLQLGWQWK